MTIRGMKSVMLLCVAGMLLFSGCRSARVTTNAATGGSSAGGKESGYEYKVAQGDTLSNIAKAYRAQGIKVTADQILTANPGLDPKIKVGQKIFIPAPAEGARRPRCVAHASSDVAHNVTPACRTGHTVLSAPGAIL
jgi:LysM repeat protein